jgi:hypothetical protein
MPGTEQLAAKVSVAIEAVERLLRLCEMHEAESWTSRYSLVLTALREGRYQAAIAEESKLVKPPEGLQYDDYPCWVVSEQLAKAVEQAVSRVRTDIWFGDQRAAIMLTDEPSSVEALGTRQERSERSLQEFYLLSSRVDPIDEHPVYAIVRERVNAQVEEELRDYPKGLGYCHTYWKTKKRIMKEQYQLDWKSPAELNSNTIFD